MMIFEDITKVELEELQALVDQKVLENDQLEYKAELKISRDSDKKEFLYDISSFANSKGGIIIYGISSNSIGEPTKIDGIRVSSIDAEILRIEEVVRYGITPRLPRLELHYIKLKNLEDSGDNIVLLVKVQKSWMKPHCANDRFYSRGQNGKFKLDVDQLRGMFLSTQVNRDELRRFRTERITNILSDNDLIGIEDGPKVIMHIVPIDFDRLRKIYTFDKDDERLSKIYSIDGYSYFKKYNIDGLIQYSGNELYPNQVSSYVQLYNFGAIESVAKIPLKETDKGVFIPTADVIPGIVKAFDSYVKIIESYDMPLPLEVFLSFVSVKGLALGTSAVRFMYRGVAKANKNVLNLDPILIESTKENVGTILRPAFDQLWRAFDYDSCDLYDS